MSRLLRRTAAVLFVVAAALLVVGVSTEDSQSETGKAVHDETAEATGSDKATELAAGSESGDDAGADEPVAAEPEPDHDEEERLLGVDVESPAAVTAAVIVSLGLAVGLWLRNRRWLAIVSVGVGVVFAVFDIAEIRHQLEESHTGIAALAAVVATAHLAAAVTAGLSTRATSPP